LPWSAQISSFSWPTMLCLVSVSNCCFTHKLTEVLRILSFAREVSVWISAGTQTILIEEFSGFPQSLMVLQIRS
jgi:hypothetical protein